MTEAAYHPGIVAAADWLVKQKEPPLRAVPVLKKDFNLTALEACQAIKLSQVIRRGMAAAVDGVTKESGGGAA